MAGYRLQKISASVWHITSGRKQVGHVTTCPIGYVARLGRHCEVGNSPQEAFDTVASLALGFTNKVQLMEHNRAVRARNAARRRNIERRFCEALAKNNGDSLKAITDLIVEGLEPRR